MLSRHLTMLALELNVGTMIDRVHGTSEDSRMCCVELAAKNIPPNVSYHHHLSAGAAESVGCRQLAILRQVSEAPQDVQSGTPGHEGILGHLLWDHCSQYISLAVANHLDSLGKTRRANRCYV